MSAVFVSALIAAVLIGIVWLLLGGAREFSGDAAAGFVRGFVRAVPDDEAAELWAARFRNAADEGLRDRDARRREG